MKRPEQVDRIRRAERERDQAYRDRDIKAARRAGAVLDAALRNSSTEEIKEANPF